MYLKIREIIMQTEKHLDKLKDAGKTGKDIYYLQGKIDAYYNVLDMIKEEEGEE